MVHADSSLIPSSVTTKAEFYEHVVEQLTALLEDQRYWVSNLANTAALLYHSYLHFPQFYGMKDHEAVVNWSGFYLVRPSGSKLQLGPFAGRPACQSINPVKGKGVCADAFVTGQTVMVEDVHEYPGHIACDSTSQSEIVLPLFDAQGRVIGVLDLDSTVKSTFDDEDRKGLETIVQVLQSGCDWE